MFLISLVLAGSTARVTAPAPVDEVCVLSLDHGLYTLKSANYKSGKVLIRQIWSKRQSPNDPDFRQVARVFTYGDDLALWIWDKGYFFHKMRGTWKFCGQVEAQDRVWSTRKGWQAPHLFRYEDGQGTMRVSNKLGGYFAGKFGPINVVASAFGISYSYKPFLTTSQVENGKRFAAALNDDGFKMVSTDGPFPDLSPMAPRDEEEYGPGFRPPLVSRWISPSGNVEAARVDSNGKLRVVVFHDMKPTGHIDFPNLERGELTVTDRMVIVLRHRMASFYDADSLKLLKTADAIAVG